MCLECDFWQANGGSCRGLQKNPAAKAPFYVCPRAAEIAIVQAYLRASLES